MIAKFLFIAVLVFACFRFINFISERIKVPSIQKTKFLHIIPVFELLMWMAYLLWIVKAIYDSRNYFALISIGVVFALVAFPLFMLIRDYITGIILKLQNRIVEGSYIELEETKGIVKKAGHLRMDIEDNHGNICSITYHLVYGKRISKTSTNQYLEKVTLEFEFPETTKVNHLTSLLKRAVMNSSWVAVSQPPIIENTKTMNGKLLVEVGAYVLDKAYAENVKASVISYFSSI